MRTIDSFAEMIWGVRGRKKKVMDGRGPSQPIVRAQTRNAVMWVRYRPMACCDDMTEEEEEEEGGRAN